MGFSPETISVALDGFQALLMAEDLILGNMTAGSRVIVIEITTNDYFFFYQYCCASLLSARTFRLVLLPVTPSGKSWQVRLGRFANDSEEADDHTVA